MQVSLSDEKKQRLAEVSKLKQEISDLRKKYESTNRDSLNRDREIDDAKKQAFKLSEDAEKKLKLAEAEIEKSKAENENVRKAQEDLIK